MRQFPFDRSHEPGQTVDQRLTAVGRATPIFGSSGVIDGYRGRVGEEESRDEGSAVTDSKIGVDQPADAYGQSLFDDMIARFVIPEVERRRAGGSLAEQELVVRFQVLFAPEIDPEVRLNAEVGGSVRVTATRSIKTGEEVTVDDISGISEYTPRVEDAGVPHVSGFLHRDRWSLVFEFGRGGHSDRIEFLRLGGDYLELAREGLARGRLEAFVDNAFSACELLAKAELLSNRPTVELVLNSHARGRGAAVPRLGETRE
jgi:hypothetical protein